jgi:hypothetical protein
MLARRHGQNLLLCFIEVWFDRGSAARNRLSDFTQATNRL